MPRLLVCSHRGPVTHRTVRGRIVAQRGGGGMVSILGPVLERHHGVWIAAAMTPEDRSAGLLDLPEGAHRLHYDVVCNEHLWFAFHYLLHEPVYDSAFLAAWDAYNEVNRRYGEVIASHGEADVVLVQDFHLMTAVASVPGGLRVPTVYFHHVPWVEPDYLWRVPVAGEMVAAVLAHDVVGFHARRWANAFLRCCERAGATVSGDEVAWRGRTSHVVVAPGPVNVDAVVSEAASPETERRREALEHLRGGRRALVRVERIDPSKNVARGLLAVETLLERRPELTDDLWFCALGYVSRPRVPRYRRYLVECSGIARRINERHRSKPVLFDVRDDFSRSLAGMRMAEVMLVNPVFDGLNLVAKEFAVVNDCGGALVLSTNAGVFEELGETVIGVNPFDVSATADGVERALIAPPPHGPLKQAALRSTTESWLAAQLAPLGL